MNLKSKRRKKIKQSIRKKIFGTCQRPRLSIYRSNREIFAQIIDDGIGHTIIASASQEKDLKIQIQKNKSEIAILVGTKLGERASKIGIKQVIFDRNGYLYHGRIKALAEAARKSGLEF